MKKSKQNCKPTKKTKNTTSKCKKPQRKKIKYPKRGGSEGEQMTAEAKAEAKRIENNQRAAAAEAAEAWEVGDKGVTSGRIQFAGVCLLVGAGVSLTLLGQ